MKSPVYWYKHKEMCADHRYDESPYVRNDTDETPLPPLTCLVKEGKWRNRFDDLHGRTNLSNDALSGDNLSGDRNDKSHHGGASVQFL